METSVARGRRPSTFNGPLEAGVRTVAILGAAFPLAFDLQRLVAFDYLLVHTADIGGPESLHPPVPLQSAALLIRRRIVEDGLLLMMTRDLVRREARPSGFLYHAGKARRCSSIACKRNTWWPSRVAQAGWSMLWASGATLNFVV